jgi:TRAP-type C4-dicarboxylate transport system permease small subunit
MVGVQLAARLIDGALALVHLPRTDFVILSLDEICGNLLAAASFLALAGTLKAGAHIRVTLVLSALSESHRRVLEIWAFGFAAAASAYGTGHLLHFAWVSFLFNEVSNGVVKVPLAIPQAAMAAGALMLTVALVDELFIVVRGGRPTFRTAEDAISLGKEG